MGLYNPYYYTRFSMAISTLIRVRLMYVFTEKFCFISICALSFPTTIPAKW